MTKREGNILLLTFAISTIIWCVGWSYAIGKIFRNYESKIEMMVFDQTSNKKCNHMSDEEMEDVMYELRKINLKLKQKAYDTELDIYK
tara:strand:+ start:924 stop:1187 length:264 start_codon:yes stop_codon:yes gene_type:complete